MTGTSFDAQVDFWDDVYDADDLYGLIHQERRRRVLRLVERLQLPTGTHAVDVGCGPGRLLVDLSLRGLVAFGADSSDAMVTAASRRMEASDPTAASRVIRGEVTSLPFADGQFSLTLAVGVLPWVADWTGALSELARITVVGGHVIATIDNRFRLNHLLDPILTPVLSPLRTRLKRMLVGTPAAHEQPTGVYLRPAEIKAAGAAFGVEVVAWEAIGFGPFTFLRHPLFGDRDGRRLHRRLQAHADDGNGLLRNTATQMLFLARRC
jgi:ubiquinone/menaquinone biosynthesis C-methylase UbiE